MTKHNYEVEQVERAVYVEAEMGQFYRADPIVDLFSKTKDGATFYFLVVKRAVEPVDWKARYHELRDLVKLCRSSTAVSKLALAQYLGRRGELEEQGERESIMVLVDEMLKVGVIRVGKKENREVLKMEADALVVVDRDTFRKLPS